MQVLNPRGFTVVFAAGTLALGLVIAGCASSTDGTATVNNAEVTAYRSEVAASSAAAASSLRAAEVADAVADNCEQFPITTNVGVTKYNEFIEAHDANAPDYAEKREAAVSTLEGAATTVDDGINAAEGRLPEDLRAKLAEYVDAARGLAGASATMTYTAPVAGLNEASKRVNQARNAVREDCEGR